MTDRPIKGIDGNNITASCLTLTHVVAASDLNTVSIVLVTEELGNLTFELDIEKIRALRLKLLEAEECLIALKGDNAH